MDVLNRRLGQIRDNGDIDFDNTAAAIDIDQELQEKFLFFPDVELSEIAEAIEEDRGRFVLGQGDAHLSVSDQISAADAYTLAENAAAIYWEVHRRSEMEQARRAKRPAPGLYTMGRIIIGVTADRRIMVQQSGTATFADRTEMYDADTLDEAKGRAWPMKALGHDFAPLP
jgi:hypothetical protein